MPFYDLKCKRCSKEFNAMASIKDRENNLIKCPDCSGTEHESVYKSVNIVRSDKSEGPSCPNAHICGCNCRH